MVLVATAYKSITSHLFIEATKIEKIFYVTKDMQKMHWSLSNSWWTLFFIIFYTHTKTVHNKSYNIVSGMKTTDKFAFLGFITLQNSMKICNKMFALLKIPNLLNFFLLHSLFKIKMTRMLNCLLQIHGNKHISYGFNHFMVVFKLYSFEWGNVIKAQCRKNLYIDGITIPVRFAVLNSNISPFSL